MISDRVFNRGFLAMTKTRFRFSSLRRLLLELGFKEHRFQWDQQFRDGPVKRTSIGFQHDESDTLIVLPGYYRSNSWVYPHHLITVRIMLDAKGFMDAEDFDRLVAQGSAQPSASS
jgi:hypothetical protein